MPPQLRSSTIRSRSRRSSGRRSSGRRSSGRRGSGRHSVMSGARSDRRASVRGGQNEMFPEATPVSVTSSSSGAGIAEANQRLRQIDENLRTLNTDARRAFSELVPLERQLASLNQASQLELMRLPLAAPSAKQAILANVEMQNASRNRLVQRVNEGKAKLQSLQQQIAERAAERQSVGREIAQLQDVLARTTIENMRATSLGVVGV